MNRLVLWTVDRILHPSASFGAGLCIGWYFGALAFEGSPSPFTLVGGIWLAWAATERW